METTTFTKLENGYSCEFYNSLGECNDAYKFLALTNLEIVHNGEVLAIDDSFLCDLVDHNENYIFKDYTENDYSCYFAISSFATIADGMRYCTIFKGLE
jgi:hypothetical protein